MSIFQSLVDLNLTSSELENKLMAISMYIYFNYSTIKNDNKIVDFLNSSQNLLNKFHTMHPEYSQEQLESIFIAFNVLLYLSFASIFNF